jgi:heptosyltransferase-2
MITKFSDTEIKRILIRSTNWVGDTVMTMPAIDAVRKIFPQSSITVLAKPWVAPLFDNHPAVDEIILYNREDGYIKGIKEIFKIVGKIRKMRFDLAILFQNAFEAALLAYLGGVPMRVGYSREGRGFLLTHKIKTTEEISRKHQSEYYLWDGREKAVVPYYMSGI